MSPDDLTPDELRYVLMCVRQMERMAKRSIRVRIALLRRFSRDVPKTAHRKLLTVRRKVQWN